MVKLVIKARPLALFIANQIHDKQILDGLGCKLHDDNVAEMS